MAQVSPHLDQQSAHTLRARFPACDGACEAGRSQCACRPAETQQHQQAHGLARVAERWPRAFNAALLGAILAMLGLAGQLDAPLADAELAALPPHFAEAPAGDGFPPELLAEVQP